MIEYIHGLTLKVEWAENVLEMCLWNNAKLNSDIGEWLILGNSNKTYKKIVKKACNTSVLNPFLV